MTGDELREMLDRFHAALARADHWSRKHGAQYIETEWHLELDGIWRNLNNHCAMMKDAERLLDTAVKPTRPLPEPPLKPSEVNAEEIGKLQAKVAQLEGAAKAMEKRIQDIAQAAAEGFEMVSDAALADGSVPE